MKRFNNEIRQYVSCKGEKPIKLQSLYVSISTIVCLILKYGLKQQEET